MAIINAIITAKYGHYYIACDWQGGEVPGNFCAIYIIMDDIIHAYNTE